jgi:predicted metalloprotease with PDZ domain
MKNRHRLIAVGAALIVVASFAFSQVPASPMAFTVSMEKPESHYLHVTLRCDGLKAGNHDFKMPAWTPGYYKIMDYARNVVGFRAEDGAGNPLAWTKTSKGTWQVVGDDATSLTVRYDVFAFDTSVADSYLDDGHGYISPTGVFMNVDGRIAQPVTVTIEPIKGWSTISTGLDPVDGRPGTFSAPDFDELYDCPILAGSQEVTRFEVNGVPHTVALDTFGTYDRAKLTADIKRIVETAVAVMGEIPYRHYTFIVMSPGVGGLEHKNSTVLICDASSLDDPQGYEKWLGFVAHEFFHLYNVKRIRPLALGPFDYDRENYTDMLWVSEGLTVYYEDQILRRAGLISPQEYLERVRRCIARYENVPGHLVQSATEASFDTWIQFFARAENSADSTISYYDKGAGLGVLLDLSIRNATQNRKSLTDVMRTLYQTYYKEQRRGLTDREFREACELTAGAPLDEIFEYASTVKEIDYPKYLAYAGLDIDVRPRELPGAWFGAETCDLEGKLVVTRVEGGSPASHAGLSARDEIIALDGTRVASSAMRRFLDAKKPGQTVRVLLSRRTGVREIEVALGTKIERSFKITPKPDPTELQSAIMKDWLNER